MPWAAFDGLPAELRRSVSGRMFLETPLLGEAWRREAGDAATAASKEDPLPHSPQTSLLADSLDKQAVQACSPD